MSSTQGITHGKDMDIDTVLEKIQPPQELLAALKPSPSCTVSEFLAVYWPLCPGSRKYTLKPNLWFSPETPNYIPVEVGDLVLPSKKLCEILDG